MTFRSIRIMEERFILLLVEDLTADKQISEQNKRHREELGKRVKERTSELTASNAQLKEEVAKRKRMEMALRESGQRFRALADGAPFGLVLINKDGTFRYINPKFRELFGTISKIYPMAENGSEGHILMGNITMPFQSGLMTQAGP